METDASADAASPRPVGVVRSPSRREPCRLGTPTNGARRVALEDLVATPEQYLSARVVVRGIASIRFETSALYVTTNWNAGFPIFLAEGLEPFSGFETCQSNIVDVEGMVKWTDSHSGKHLALRAESISGISDELSESRQ